MQFWENIDGDIYCTWYSTIALGGNENKFKIIRCSADQTSGKTCKLSRVRPIPINQYRMEYGDFPNRYRFFEIDPFRYRYRYLYHTDIPIPISPISISSIPNRYRYPPNPPYRTDFFHTDTDTWYRYLVSVPGIGTWYPYLVSVS